MKLLKLDLKKIYSNSFTRTFYFLSDKTYYLFGLTCVLGIYISYFNYLDWSGDYALYILQGKYFSIGEVNSLIKNMRLSLSLSQNINPYSPDYYPWGLPLFIYLTSFLHNWNIVFIKFLNPVSIFFIFIILNFSSKEKTLQKYLLSVLAIVYSNNLLFYLIIQPSIFASLFLLLSYFCFDKNKKNYSVLFFLIACLVRTNFIFFSIYFLFNQKFIENLKYFSKVFLCFVGTYFTFFSYYKLNIFGNYEFIPIFEIKNDVFRFQSLYNSMVDFLIKLSELLFFNRLPASTYIGLLIVLIFIYLSFKNLNFSVILFFLLFTFLINHFFYLIDVKRILTPIIFIILYFASKEKLDKKIVIFLIFFTFYNILNTFLIIQNIDKSQNVLNEQFNDVVVVINNEYKSELIGFHKPRILMLYSTVVSYKLTQENFDDYIKNSLVLCDKSFFNCPEFSYETLYENEGFKIIKEFKK